MHIFIMIMNAVIMTKHIVFIEVYFTILTKEIDKLQK